MHCLVLGGAGFIGSHIIDALVARHHLVRVFDLPNIDRKNIKHHLSKIEILKGDFCNIREIDKALNDIDVVIHLAWTTVPGPSNENPSYDVESNLIGTLNLLQNAVKKGIKKIVFASSGGTVYGIPQSLPISETHPTNPLCSYGITKLAIEKYLALYWHLYKLDYVVLRISNPYGERQNTLNIQGAIAVFLGKILRKEIIDIWGNGTIARDFLYIKDLVPAFIKAIEADTQSKIYNIASGYAQTLNEIVNIIGKITNTNPRIRYLENRKFDVIANCLDIKRAGEELNWKPEIKLEEGIKNTWDWLVLNSP